MKLVAQKPCSFGGQKFTIGKEIPSDLVVNPQYMKKLGVIAIINESETPHLSEIVSQVAEVKFEIQIHAEEGELPLLITNQELSVFTDILQIGVNKAEDKQKISEMIQKVESNDLLILLDALDGRKFVRDEARKRADALSNPGGDE